MILSVSSFADTGNIEKERVVLRVDSSGDVGRYAVLLSKLTGEHPSAGNQPAYWFPDVPVNEGDLVVLYTKNGSKGKKDLRNGRQAHFLYWGMKTPIWQDDTKKLVILEINKWISSSPSVLKQDDEL
ncbi:hypothetical protein [Luteibacter sp. dw_328]|uniref:hypothetical protein n=1 Tax=Luteibacter sp. dw_328 TaxID=2719796 RepID=UPI001BD696C5|nr:hypothetical protein [Luteibacter sp. dw_328]